MELLNKALNIVFGLFIGCLVVSFTVGTLVNLANETADSYKTQAVHVDAACGGLSTPVRLPSGKKGKGKKKLPKVSVIMGFRALKGQVTMSWASFWQMLPSERIFYSFERFIMKPAVPSLARVIGVIGYCVAAVAIVAAAPKIGLLAAIPPIELEDVRRMADTTSAEAVISVDASKLAENDLVKLEHSVRNAGGMRGAEVVKKAIGAQQESITMLELPSLSKASEGRKASLISAISKMMVEMKMFISQGPNSTIGIKMYDNEDQLTRLGKFVATIGPVLTDVQQYVNSLLMAPVIAPIGESSDPKDAFKPVKAVTVVYNYNLPIGKDAEGNDVPLADAGTDGTFNATGDGCHNQGQVRGFWVKLEESIAGLIKGMRMVDRVYGYRKVGGRGDGQIFLVKPQMSEWHSVDKFPVEVLDLNMIKAAGKNTKPYRLASRSNIKGLAFEIKEDVYMWHISTLVIASFSMVATSFQDTVFWSKKIKVEASEILDTLNETLFGACEKHDAIVKGLEGSICNLMNIPYDPNTCPTRIFVESMGRTVAKMASSGTTREKRFLRERWNSYTPLGLTVCDDFMRYYTTVDELTLVQEAETKKGDSLTEEEKAQVIEPTFQKVAQTRLPTISYHCSTVRLNVSQSFIIKLKNALLAEEQTVTACNGEVFTTSEVVIQLMRQHNRLVRVKKHKDVAEHDFESMRSSLISLGYAIEYANLEGCFICHPAEGRDRQSDCDGDMTAHDNSLWWVNCYEQLEKESNLKPRFCLEAPKANRRKWFDESLKLHLPNPDGELVLSTHPKGMSILDMFPGAEWFTISRSAEIAKELLAPLQGATGLASNQAADCYARIVWQEVLKDGKVVAIEPTPETRKHFVAYVFNAVLIQCFIDNQKGNIIIGYMTPRNGGIETFVNALVKADGEMLDSFIVDGIEEATPLDTYDGWAYLDINYTLSPELVYPFAQEYMLVGNTCTWKANSKTGVFQKSGEEIMSDIHSGDKCLLNPNNRVTQTIIAANHPTDGWRTQFAKSLNHINRLTSRVKAAKNSLQEEQLDKIERLSLRVPKGFAEVHYAQINKTVDEDITKMSALARGNAFLRGLGFVDEGVLQDISSGEDSIHNGEINTSYSLEEILIAMLLGADNREVDAYEIVMSWLLAIKDMEENEINFLAEAKSNFVDMLTYFQVTKLELDSKNEIISTNKEHLVLNKSQQAPKVWSALHDRAMINLDALHGKITELFHIWGLDYENPEHVQLFRFAFNDFLRLVKTAKYMATFPKNNILMPFLSRKEMDEPEVVVPKGYGQKQMEIERLAHLRLLGQNGCPISQVRNYIKKDIGFRPQVDLISGFNLIKVLASEDTVVSSRSILGGSGYVSDNTFVLLEKIAKGKIKDPFYVRNLLTAACSSLIRIKDKEDSHLAKQRSGIRQMLVQSKVQYLTYNMDLREVECNNVPEGVLSTAILHPMEELCKIAKMTLTPLPKRFKYKLDSNRVVEGHEAVAYFFLHCLAGKITRYYNAYRFVGNGIRGYEETQANYSEALNAYLSAVNSNDEVARYLDTLIGRKAVEAVLNRLTFRSVYKEVKPYRDSNGEWKEVWKDRDEDMAAKLNDRLEKVWQDIESYERKLGL